MTSDPVSDPASDPAPVAGPADAPTLEQRVRERYPELSPTERQLADAVLTHRDALLGYTATELATLAGVSKASAARFFRRLGYADYQGFRASVRGEAGAAAPLDRLPRELARGTTAARLAGHVADDRQCLARLPALVEPRALDVAVEQLVGARRLGVLGFRNAHAVAVYAQSLLHQVRPDVQLLNDAAARDTEWLADLGEADVVLAIDLRRRTARLGALLTAVRACGARCVLLTDTPVCALDGLAEAVLRVPIHAAEVFDAYVAPISLVNFLAAAVAARGGAGARARLAHIERLHAALADLEGPPPAAPAADLSSLLSAPRHA